MKDRTHAYGEEAHSFLDNFIFSLRKRQVVKRLPEGKQVVADFGSGFNCRLLRSIWKTNPRFELVAVDTEFDQSLEEHPNLKLVKGNLNEELDIKDSSIDVGLSLAVLEHLDKPDVFLSELHRVMKPGGTVLLTTPGPTSKPLLEFMAFKLGIIDAHEIRDHKHYFSSEELVEAFVKAGFKKDNIDARTFIFGMNNVVKVVR